MKWLLLLATVTSLLLAASSGQVVQRSASIWEPSSIARAQELRHKPTVPHEIVKSLRIGDVTIALEETVLGDMQRKFGGTIGASGDASESLKWLCLTGRDKSGPWVLWLESSETDGPSIGGFQLRRSTNQAKVDKRCQSLAGAEIGLPHSLRLGMTESEAVKALGRPTSRRRDMLFYFHEHEERFNNEPYTSDNNVTMVLRNGKVWAVEAWKSTIN